MKNKFRLYSIALIAVVATTFVACEPEGSDALLGKGSNFVRLVEGANELNIFGVDLKPGDASTPLVQIIRDVNSNAELSKPASVSLKVDNSLITAYNTAKAKEAEEAQEDYVPFEPLPANIFKLSETSVQLASGDFGKVVNLIFDPTKLTSGVKYALGVSIDNAGEYKTRNGLGSALFQIIAKNKYHGRYKAIGYFTHPVATSSRAIDRLKELVTVNENTVSAELGDLGGAGYNFNLTVNADNSVTITNTGAGGALKTDYQKNFYDPATKSFNLKYSYNTAAPRIINEVLTLQ
jgi:Domain of unknown function (DUF1735)/Domain of unknown function (DUF4361)